MKAFLIDIAYCNGCHNCQIACKDEHCRTSWLPYAAEQPLTGQFWLKVEEKVRGTVPKTRMNYIPRIGGQNDKFAEAAADVLMPREDGIVVIDPEKAKGRKDLAEFEGVYWNEELQIPQTCTGCAHLIDDGWTVPRCVDSCPTEALKYVDVEDIPEGATQETEGSHVWYLYFPKRFVTGCLVDFEADEVVIDAEVELCVGNVVVATVATDEFGDFMFDQVEAENYVVKYNGKEVAADATALDVNLGDMPY